MRAYFVLYAVNAEGCYSTLQEEWLENIKFAVLSVAMKNYFHVMWSKIMSKKKDSLNPGR